MRPFPTTNHTIPTFTIGSFFSIVPAIHLYDNGNNFAYHDSSSYVVIGVDKNPGNCALRPADFNLFRSIRGIVKLTSFSLNCPGEGYRFAYYLHQDKLSALKRPENSSTIAYSVSFNMVTGDPVYLDVVQAPLGAWAGNQPFLVQPRLALTDYGGSTVDANSVIVQAYMVSSPGSRKSLSIVSNYSIITRIIDISCDTVNISYGAGDTIQIMVHFQYEIWVENPTNITLMLNIVNDGSYQNASLQMKDYSRVKTLKFNYEIQLDDNVKTLDVESFNALQLGSSGTIKDGNGASANLDVPMNRLSTYNLSVNTSAPQILAIMANVSAGEYGVGEVLKVTVVYDFPVVVSGIPILMLLGTTGANDSIVFKYKNFGELGSYYVSFLHVVSKGESATNLIPSACEILLNSSTSSIKRYSKSPGTDATLSFDCSLFSSTNLSINTERPELNVTYGLRTNHDAGIFYAGELIEISLKFSKQIIIIGDNNIKLILDVGFQHMAEFYYLDDDNMTIWFKFFVPKDADILALDISGGNSLVLPKSGSSSILRLSSNPSDPADISTGKLYLSNSTLRFQTQLRLNGFVPRIQLISLFNLTQIDYYPDDIILIVVNFSIPIISSCSLSLAMNLNSRRYAQYVSGNGTSSLIFTYKVLIGDESNGLYMRYFPNALCSSPNCISQQKCVVTANASVAYLQADLTVPKSSGSTKSAGVLINSHINIHPRPMSRNTTITSISVNLTTGVYFPGTAIWFYVQFSDVVYISTEVYPRLYLNIDTFAEYDHGSNSDTLWFLYIANISDSTVILKPERISTNSCILCPYQSNCLIRNKASDLVDLSTENSLIYSTEIILDDIPPSIQGLYVSSAENYQASDFIVFMVEYDRNVIVKGPNPKIGLLIGKNYRFADYYGNHDNFLCFRYQITIDDGCDLLKVGKKRIIQESSNIYALSHHPIVIGNLSFEHLSHINKAVISKDVCTHSQTTSQQQQLDQFNVSTCPITPSIKAMKPVNATDKIYRAGDKILIEIVLSDAVLCTGETYLLLNCGLNARKAFQVDFSNNSHVEQYATSYYFLYIVESNDFTLALDVVDSNSWIPGVDQFGNDASCFSAPGVELRIDLPLPGISAFQSIVVDGRLPQLKQIGFVNSPGEYSVGATVCVQFDFSASVVVIGNPYIVLNTSPVVRRAEYVASPPSNQVLFCYEPQPGDVSTSLDYQDNVERSLSNTSYVSNGGNIFTASDYPTQVIEVVLNPSGSILSGELRKTFVSGLVNFRDLSLSKFGQYRLNFYCENPHHKQLDPLVTSVVVNVSFSNEFEIRPREATSGVSNIGEAVAVYDDIAIMTSPSSFNPSLTIQSVSTFGTEEIEQQEIQMFSTSIQPRPLVQQFSSMANAGVDITGTFSISYDSHGTTRDIPSNADENILYAILSYDLPSLGKLKISRRVNTYCACVNAFIWTITFLELTEGIYSPISLNDQLQGEGAEMVGPILLQSPSVINGSFRFFISEFNLSTNDLPYNARSKDIVFAFKSLGIEVDWVDVSSPVPSRSFTWIVKFGLFNGTYEIPTINMISFLEGGNISVSSTVIQEGIFGVSGLSGFFLLEFRGEKTDTLSYDVDALSLKEALEELPTINLVDVSRFSTSAIGSYTWRITFYSVNKLTSSGYVVDTGTIDSLVSYNFLNGKYSQIFVGYDQYNYYDDSKTAIFVYQLVDEVWAQVATLYSPASNADQSVNSLSLENGTLVLGEPYSREPQKRAIYSFYCRGFQGSFRFNLNNFTSAPILSSYNVTEALKVLQNSFPSIAKVTFEPFNNSIICNGRIFQLSYISKLSQQQSFQLVDIVPASTNSSTYDLKILKIQNESISDTSTASGSVTIFRLSSSKRTEWIQDFHLLPSTNDGIELFGYAVSLSGNWLAISCPGCGYGQIFFYQFDGISWKLSQRFTNTYSTKGSFGYALEISGNVASVGDPYSFDGYGAVYSLLFSDDTRHSYLVQVINGSSVYAVPGAKFGSSVSIENDTMIISSPYLTTDKSINVGGVYVYKKVGFDFLIFQKLETEFPLSHRSRFGYRVKLKGNKIVVSSLTEYIGKFVPSTTVIRVRSNFTQQPLNSLFFRLKWGSTVVNGVHADGGTSSPISVEASSTNMLTILENDFKIGLRSCRSNYIEYACSENVGEVSYGPIFVSRSRNNYGYNWDITFTGVSRKVPLFQALVDGLQGVGTIEVSYLNKPFDQVRDFVSIFMQEEPFSSYIEEAILRPYNSQPMDRCGLSVGISESHVIIGCPNRDYVPFLSNTGSAFIHRTDFLNMKFANNELIAREGEIVEVDVLARGASRFYVRTVDRDSLLPFQLFLGDIYDAEMSDTSYPETVIDYIGKFGSAIAKTSNDLDSNYVFGHFDSRGIADYSSLLMPFILPATSSKMENASMKITIHEDYAYETPSENFSIAMFSPGFWPSQKGRLTAIVEILEKQQYNLSYTKLYDDSSGNRFFGSVVRTFGKLIAVGSTDYDFNLFAKAIIYIVIDNQWRLSQVLTSPTNESDQRSFASDIAIGIHDLDSICAISEPHRSRVHIFVSNDHTLGRLHSLEASIVPDQTMRPESGFGIHGTLAYSDGLLVVGAPGIETVFTFKRLFSKGTYYWSNPSMIKSSDFDFDIISSFPRMHAQGFGTAVSLSMRMLVVGAPYADYSKLGTDAVEVNWNSDGESIMSYGRGKVYVFESVPCTQVIRINSKYPAHLVRFRLSYNDSGQFYTSDLINGSSSSYDVQRVLSLLPNIGSIDVSSPSIILNSSFANYWKVTFMEKYANPPLLQALWYDHGCDDCIGGNSSWPLDSIDVHVTYESYASDFQEIQALSADGGMNGDRFGASVSVDKHLLVVGSPYAGAPDTTWDFETGNLKGWSSSGNAFLFQPTLGDNSRLRTSQSSVSGPVDGYLGDSSNVNGNYFIGTYEKRPNLSYPIGNIQGNKPQGSLLSDPFMILGSSISFLVGGGCDILSVYVGLLVDGLLVDKVTGQCSETMRPRKFDVSGYKGRAAAITIVDKSSVDWGHINVDDFEFSWTKQSSADFRSSRISPQCGAAYIYEYAKVASTSSEKYEWKFVSRIYASDMRTGVRFASSVKIDSTRGLVFVGSPFTERKGVNKEFLVPYPFGKLNPQPFNSSLERYFVARSSFSPLPSGSPGYWLLDKNYIDTRLWQSAGAVYIYTRTRSVKSSNGSTIEPEYWHPYERMKIQPSDGTAGDRFGSSLDTFQERIIVGAPGNDGLAKDSGGAYVFDSSYAYLYFDKVGSDHSFIPQT
jgi:hypothetical protein